MTAREDNELFEDCFHEWLEEHGVEFSSIVLPNQFFVKVDINKLKIGMLEREMFIERKVHKERRVAHKKEELINSKRNVRVIPMSQWPHGLGDSGNEAERLQD